MPYFLVKTVPEGRTGRPDGPVNAKNARVAREDVVLTVPFAECHGKVN